MARGPKPTPRKSPHSTLTPRVPPGMPAAVARAYRALAKELAAEGYACQADWRTVALAATTQAHHDRLSALVAGMEGLTLAGANGGERLHPLVVELRAVGNQLAGLYAQLLLTPRSRSASRMTETQARAAGAKGDDMEAFLDG